MEQTEEKLATAVSPPLVKVDPQPLRSSPSPVGVGGDEDEDEEEDMMARLLIAALAKHDTLAIEASTSPRAASPADAIAERAKIQASSPVSMRAAGGSSSSGGSSIDDAESALDDLISRFEGANMMPQGVVALPPPSSSPSPAAIEQGRNQRGVQGGRPSGGGSGRGGGSKESKVGGVPGSRKQVSQAPVAKAPLAQQRSQKKSVEMGLQPPKASP